MSLVIPLAGGVLENVLNGATIIDTSQVTLPLISVPNYITNPGAESNTTGWNTFADAAANIPVDMTGGSATNLTFSRSTSSPLRGTAQFSLVQANSTSLQGKGVSTDFTIAAADKGKNLSISFDFNASSTFVASNGTTAPLNDGTTTTNAGNSDIEVFIYDVTNAVLIPVSPQVIAANGANNFLFKGVFQTASNSTSYRLGLYVATTSANATGWTFLFDNVFVNAQPILQGAPETDWSNALSASFTPSASFGTITNQSIWTKRSGDRMFVRGSFTMGTVTAAVAYIQLPAGYTIDLTKMTNTLNNSVLYSGGRIRTTTGTFDATAFFCDGTTNNQIFVTQRDGTTTGLFNKDNANQTFAANEAVAFAFDIPISGWSSTVLMSNDTSSSVVAATYTMSSNQTPGANTQLNFDTKLFDTHGAVTTGAGWKFTAPVSGIYSCWITALWNATASGGAFNLYKNGSSYVEVSSSYGSGSATNSVGNGKVNIQLIAGDFIDFRPTGASTFTGSGAPYFTYVSIHRISGPSTIATTDSVAARYFASATSLSGALATIVWTTKDYDLSGGMASGIFTIPIAGKYQVNTGVLVAATFAASNASVIEIQKNSSVVTRSTQNAGGIQGSIHLVVSDIINCIPGDTLRVQVSSAATGPSISASNFDNFISVMRLGN